MQQKSEEDQKYGLTFYFQKQLAQLCNYNTQCQDLQCENIHPRCFIGVCIQELKGKGECISNNCSLKHFNIKDIKTEQSVGPINGIYRFNLCSDPQCKNNQNCKFIHIKWAEKLCVKNLNDECKQMNEHDDLKHIDWQDLKVQIYSKQNIGDINPENLCLKDASKCDCNLHLPSLNEFCLLNFKGMCPCINCLKKHCFWEDFKTNVGQIQSEAIQNCIFLHQRVQIEEKNMPVFLQEFELVRLKLDIKEMNRIDIIFIMDCTGSMGEWIKQSSQQIYTLIENFQKSVPDSYTIRVGFVGYRDFCDGNNRIVSYDLTFQVDNVKKFIELQQATGGGDEAEDVYGGIEKASDLNISKNKETILVTFLFADAPTHGIQYHNGVQDEKTNVPTGQLESLMQKYLSLKAKNFFYCVTINKSTEKMYNIMKDNFKAKDGVERFFIIQASKPQDFSKLVEFRLNESFKKSQTISLNEQNYKRIKAIFIKPRVIPYVKVKDRKNYWFTFHQKLKENLRKRPTELKINEENIKFKNSDDEGQTCFVYEIKDSRNCREMIAKIPKGVVEEYDRTGKVSAETKNKADQYAQSRFEALAIAKQLALVYRNRTKSMKGAPRIFYVTPMIYELAQPFKGITKIYAETFINLPKVEWIKYTNNQAHAEKDYYYMTSFSHFTSEESEGLFVVTDLQGKLNILSDPSIQTSESFNLNLMQDETNQQIKGVGQFFYSQHQKCSQICNQLGLKNCNQNIDLDKTSFDQNAQIIYICEICDEYREMSQIEYQKSESFRCQLCYELEKTNEEVKCNCCQRVFQLPYEVSIKTGTNITSCDDCKNICEKNRNFPHKCCYCEIQCQIKLKERQIGNQKVYLCHDSFSFLNRLICGICKMKYDSSKLIDIKSYLKGEYICNKCSK